MRILILANSDIGLAKFRSELIEKLCRKHEVVIALPYGQLINSLTKFGCRFIPVEFNRRGKNPFADLLQLKKYARLIKENKPDIVLLYTIKPNIYGGLVCQKLGTPYIVNITGLGTAIENGGFLRLLSFTLYKFALRKASCVFFQNKTNHDLFINTGMVKPKTRVIPGSGVNLNTHSLEPYPSDESGIRFLFVGRIMKDKGIDELLAAITRIHDERKDVTADIVGWSDEDYAESLKKAESLGAIRFHGLQTDVHTFYKNCHCLVLPSYHEGTSNVVLEASSTGRPVITTRVPGCRETFEEGITGIGCSAKDTDSLIEAMNKFLSLTQEQRIRMGLNARDKMEKEFDRNIVIKAYEEEIDKIIKK